LRLHLLIVAASLTVSGDEDSDYINEYDGDNNDNDHDNTYNDDCEKVLTIFPQRKGGRFCTGRDERKCEGEEFKTTRNFDPQPFSEKIQHIKCS